MVTPGDLIGPQLAIDEYRVPAARDVVIVARFEGGGLLSYRHSGGSYVHTLNTSDGLARKLAQLGIDG